MFGEEEDVFESVAWETPSAGYTSVSVPSTSTVPGFKQSTEPEDTSSQRGPHDPRWDGYLVPSVEDPIKELAETKDAYVSYLVSSKTNLDIIFSTRNPSARRRFQDFVFLREHLAKNFPACVVPPLPDKHRLEYVTGDRFSPEFLERRRQDLDLFLKRVCRHPTLQRSTLVGAFFESTEWHVTMHRFTAHPPGGPDSQQGVFDSISDTLLNAFAKLRKPDERFLAMREGVDKSEDGLHNSERIWNRLRSRTSDGDTESREDLSSDYHDLAVAVQGLGFLESGITDPLNHYSNTLLEFSTLLRHMTTTTTDPFLAQLRSLIAYSHAHRAVLRLRDQKQLDFEELSNYLSGVTLEHDRLSAVIAGRAGSTGLGLSTYLRDKVDALRGADDDRIRVERMKKLEARMKELEEAVIAAHETSDAFSNETLKEQAIYQKAKEVELKEMLGSLADGHVEMYKAAIEEWERIIPILQRIRVDV